MAVHNHIIPLTGLLAASDLSACQFHLVALDSSGTVGLCASGDPGLLGVLLNKPTTGQVAQIAAVGSICEVYAGGVIGVGNLLKCGATGHIEASLHADDGGYTVGLALEAAAAAAELIRCKIWFPKVIASMHAYSTST